MQGLRKAQKAVVIMKLFLLLFFRILTLGYLFLCARSDLHSRQIRPLWAVLITGAAAVLNLLFRVYPPADLLLSGSGAVFLFLVSFASHSAIGYGDDFVILACFALLGAGEELFCFLAGLLLSALWSASLLIRKKAGRKDTLPFLPFLLAGHICVFLAELALLIAA